MSLDALRSRRLGKTPLALEVVQRLWLDFVGLRAVNRGKQPGRIGWRP